VKNLLIQQTEILTLLRESNEMTRQIISPSPKLLEIMQETNKSLQQFKESLDKLNQATAQLAQEEIEIAVRKELEKFFTNIMNNKDAK
jgi:prephenate dehydrogenase